MKKLYFLILLSLYSILSHAQIVCPDTVAIDSNISFSTPVSAISYTWGFNAAATIDTPIGSAVYISNVHTNAAYSAIANNNGHWYFFTTNSSGDTITRFDYGTDPTGTYTSTLLSGFGFTSPHLSGIEVIKDSVTNKWYVFAVNYNQLLRMSFDTSLSGPHTDTIINLVLPTSTQQLSIKKYGNEWVGFIGANLDKITRLDFGSAITNVPVTTQLPYVAADSAPRNFALYNEGGNWYMLVSNAQPNIYPYYGTLVRLDFGADIKNNSPTGVNLGGFGTFLQLNRGITILKNCNQLVAYVYDDVNYLVRLDFHGSILNHPDSSRSHSFFFANSAIPLAYGDSLYDIITCNSSGNMFRQPLVKLNADTITYYQRQVTHTFTTSGIHDVSLYCDMGAATGSFAFCKSIFVRPHDGVANTPLNKNSITTYPNPVNDEWIVSIPGSDKNAVLYLYALDGKLMQTAHLQSGVNKLNITNLNAGYYFYRITGEQNAYTGKLLKQ